MQISAIVLYGKNGKKRVLSFNNGTVNIITGKSKTGKSVIGDIIDYCFGGSSCNIAEGFVREHVAWYGLHIIHNGEYIFVARENPPRGQESTNNCCYLIGEKEIPDSLSRASPISNEGLEKILSAKLGISEIQFTPPPDQSRQPLPVNIRHSLFYCIQNQDEIASQDLLFHRQAEPFVGQAIKDTLPYFLGITDENSLALESELTQLKREATILRRNIEEAESVKGTGFQMAPGLLAEAQEVGLLPNDLKVNFSDYKNVRETLQTACQYKIASINISGMDRLSLLQNQLEELQHDINDAGINIRNAEEFIGQVKGYGVEVSHQKNRLESINLFEQLDFEPNHCPFCSKLTENPLPSVRDIRDSITRLSNELNSVSKDPPHLRKFIDGLISKRQQLLEQTKTIQLEIDAIYEENKAANQLKDINARRGRVIGRISLWLESVIIFDELDEKRNKLKNIETQIDKIKSILGKDESEERLQSVLSRLSSMMSKWSIELQLEHSEYPYRLDLSKLTVVVDRDRPVPLQQLGSGSNWLGCHLITLFALHTFFIRNNRPVPGFLFLDQPSQVFFPPEIGHENADSQEIRLVYKFIFDRISELYPNMQVIIVDHADINEPYFQDAVVEKWWDGTKLVPTDWE